MRLHSLTYRHRGQALETVRPGRLTRGLMGVAGPTELTRLEAS